MKTLTVAAVFGLLGALALPASAQPYPTYDQPQSPPPAQAPPYARPAPYDPYALQPQQPRPGYDPNGDTDPDIDGYDAEYDISTDNAAAANYDDGYDPNAYQQFQGALDPYGRWVEDPDYGHVWVPSESVVGNDFQPYASNGHWVLSEYGWTWASDWDWGWGPFHYGRWTSCAGYGWCWLPGTVWGPGWVSWRSGGGYVGWAPLPPRGVTIGPPLGVRSPWRFTVAGQLGLAHPSLLPAQTVPQIIARTSVISNLRSVSIGNATVHVNAGPTGIAVGAGVGISTPVTLRTVAPQSLPRINIVPHAGVPLEARPWVQAGVQRAQLPSYPRTSIPIGPQHPYTPQPIYNRPVYQPHPGYAPPASYHPSTAPRSYAPPAQYAPPAAYAPAQQYRPAPTYYHPAQPTTYHYAPAPSYRSTYSAPSYSAPAQSYHPTYSAPSYSAPAQSYSRPSTSSSSRPSAPSGGRGGGRR